jgi:hypothetical protein
VTPKDALAEATKILMDHFALIVENTGSALANMPMKSEVAVESVEEISEEADEADEKPKAKKKAKK